MPKRPKRDTSRRRWMKVRKMTYLLSYIVIVKFDDGSEVALISLIFGQYQISSLLRKGRCCKTSENDSTSLKSWSVRETRDGGRRKLGDGAVLLTSSATANETTPEFSPSNCSSTSEDGKFWTPHSDMGLFKRLILKVLKLGGHNPQGKE